MSAPRPFAAAQPWAYRVQPAEVAGIVYGSDRDAALEAAIFDVLERLGSLAQLAVAEVVPLDTSNPDHRALYHAELQRLREERGTGS